MSLRGTASSTVKAVWRALGRVRHLAYATLREIFDEAAYDRFLLRHAAAPSRAAYAAFRRETETDKARRPRCC